MWARASAGVIPGFFVAAALVGWACWLVPGSWKLTLVPGVVGFFPIWVGIICASFRFADGKHAWAWLCSQAVLGIGLLWFVQRAGWLD